jgi:hypothetical protein
MLCHDLIKQELNAGSGVRGLARKIDVCPAHIIRFRDSGTKPNEKTLAKLSRYFNRSPQELLAGDELTEQILALVSQLPDEGKHRLLEQLLHNSSFIIHPSQP